MKRMTKALALMTALALPTFAHAAGGGIANSDHDFTKNENGDNVTQTNGTVGGWTTNANVVGLCTFCHTPHSAITTQLLWNHKLSANTFSWEDTATAGGTTYPSTVLAPAYKGPSIKCLSCHDGSTAVGDLSLFNGQKNPVYNMYQVGTPVTNNVGGTTNPNPEKTLGIQGSVLVGNHPIGMPYPLNQAQSTYNGIQTGARVPLTDFVATPQMGANGSANSNGTFIKLYNDAGTGLIQVGAAGAATGIECTSCHDPHDKQTVDSQLLRAKKTGATAASGYICLQCHIK
jgi:hypothetical protein